MPNDRKIDVSFSASAEDYIRRFMEAVEQTRPNPSLVPIIIWWIEGTFTDKVTGKVTKLVPSIDVGAIEQNKLTDELIVPMGGLKVAIRLPDELQSADRLRIDFWTVLLSSIIDFQSPLLLRVQKIMSSGSWRRLGVPLLGCTVLPRRHPDLLAWPHSGHVWWRQADRSTNNCKDPHLVNF